jgi:hypothetical protein
MDNTQVREAATQGIYLQLKVQALKETLDPKILFEMCSFPPPIHSLSFLPSAVSYSAGVPAN